MEVKTGIRAVVLGSSGSGKSTLARLIFLHYLKRNIRDRYYVIDVYDTHWKGNEIVPGLKDFGFKIVNITPETLDEIQGDLSYEEKIALYNWRELFRGIPRAIVWIELPTELRVLAVECLANAIRSLGNAVVLIDEVSHFIGNTERRASHEVAMLMSAGRPKGIDTIAVSQHANFTNPLLRDSANVIISFKCTSDREIEILSSKFGARANELRELDAGKREFLATHTMKAWTYRSTIDAGLTM